MHIKKISSSFFRDVVSMYGVAAANLLLPILFVPYASSKVGIENFGVFAVLAAFFQYGIMFVEFGTTSPLVRLLASNANISIFWDVVLVRFCLFIVALVLIVFTSVFFLGYTDKFTFIIGSASLLGTVFNPIAIYQAKGRLPYFSFITFVSRVLVTLLAFVLLQYRKDLWIVFTFQFLPVFVVSLFSIFFIFKKEKIEFRLGSDFFKNKELSRDSISIFMGTVFSSGYTVAIPFIINSFFGSYAAGIFGIIDRVAQPIRQIIMPVVNIIYPKVCSMLLVDSHKAIYFSIKFSALLGALSFFFLIMNLIFVDSIYSYIFKGVVNKQYIYPILFNVFFIYVSQILIFLFVIPLGRGGVLKKVYVWMLVFFLMIISISVYFNSLIFTYWTFAAVEFLGMVLLLLISISVLKNRMFINGT